MAKGRAMAGEDDSRIRVGRVSRRDLLGGGATLGVAVAASGASGEAAPADGRARPDDPNSLTYRETEHIRAFYRRSRI